MSQLFSGKDTRCKKQASTVRKRYSVYENPLFLHGRRFQRNSVLKTGSYGTEEIFGAKNSLLWYATHLQRPAEQPTPQTVDSLLPTGRIFRGPRCMKTTSCPPDASSVRETAPALFVRSGPFHHFLRPANAELVSGGPFPCSFDGTRYQKRPPLGCEQT